MTTLKIGITGYNEMRTRTMAVTRSERRIAATDPKVLFTSTRSFANALSTGNRALLHVIAEKAPGALDKLAQIPGKIRSTLSGPRPCGLPPQRSDESLPNLL